MTSGPTAVTLPQPRDAFASGNCLLLHAGLRRRERAARGDRRAAVGRRAAGVVDADRAANLASRVGLLEAVVALAAALRVRRARRAEQLGARIRVRVRIAVDAVDAHERGR